MMGLRGQGRTRSLRIIAGVCVLAVVAVAGWFVFVRTDDSRTVVADFAYVNGIFKGSKVAILGVPVGTVESVVPAGSVVRVTMSMPGSVQLPAGVQSFVMNPSVISDRNIELGPAYQGGAQLAEGAVIPVERNHSPINWDQLMASVNTIMAALGPDGGDIGSTLNRAAEAADGQGPAMRTAIRNISQATSLFAGKSDDIGALIENLNKVISAFSARQGTVDSVTTSLAQIGDEIQSQDLDLGTPIAQLKTLFDKIDQLVRDRSGDISAAVANAKTVTDQFAAHQSDFAEFMDLLPLMMQNIGNTITPDQRARIRLDVSTTLTQIDVARPLCDKYLIPMCSGAGLTNPISVPISASDPFGIASLLRGAK